ncbi:MAG: hypothetical protein H0V22_10190 [Solirubrobacterales bacterium]|nr:hypothetical protein [Solirubrobacterales bacterium]
MGRRSRGRRTWSRSRGRSLVGLPLARDQQFVWLTSGLMAFSVRKWRSWPSLIAHWLPLFLLLVAYDILRGAVAVADAQAHATPQLGLDRALFGADGRPHFFAN